MPLLMLGPRVAPGAGTDSQAAFFKPIGAGLGTYPEVQLSIDWTNDPTSGTRNWQDATAYLRAWAFQRGAESELQRVAPGEMSLVCSNRDGRFHAENSSGPYFPNVRPMRHVRLRLRWGSIIYPAFEGLLQDIPVEYPGYGADSLVSLSVVDAFSALSLLPISTDLATMTTTLGGDSDITFTAKGTGVDGNGISVVYYKRERLPNKSLILNFTRDSQLVIKGETGKRSTDRVYPALTIAVALEMTGDEPSTETVTSAADLVAAINEHDAISEFVEATLPADSDGSGLLDTMPRTMLAGGTYVEELTGARVNHVLDDAGWPANMRNIDNGDLTITGSSFSASSETSALSHLLEVDESEGGRLFVDREGRIRFERRRYRAHNRTSAVTLGELPGELGYDGLTLERRPDEIRNIVNVSSAHSVTDVHVEDAASIQQNFRRALDVDSLSSDRFDAEARANYLLGRYSQPTSRSGEVEVKPAANVSLWPAVLGRDISDLVTRRRRPLYGGLYENEQRIERIRMECVPGSLRVYWGLSAAVDNFWILEDPVKGVLGTTTVAGW